MYLFILIFIFIFQGVRTLISLFSSLNFLKNNYKVVKGVKQKKETRFIILIPCLSEQKNIRTTLAYFKQICEPISNICFLYTVTTEREKKEPNIPTTWEIIQSEIKDKGYTNIQNIHYPHNNELVSYQLNYALNILEDQMFLRQSDYIVIYNADSRPHPQTFNWVLNENSDNIYQQLSTVFKNFDSFNNYPKGMLLKACAVLQTRFSLVHELPRLRRTVSKSQFLRKYANAHCITHGLFIPYNKFTDLGKFSEDTMTEDLFLSFLIRAKGNEIQPIPYLENIDSPTSALKNIRQKYIWYWGPMYYPHYYMYYKKKFDQNKNSLRVFILMVQGIISAMSWALSGPLLVCGIILGIVNYHLLMGQLLIITVLIYAPLQYIIIISKYKEIIKYTTGNLVKKRSIMEFIFIPMFSFLAILINSIPTYASMFMEISHIIFGVKLHKPKTES